MERIIKRDEPSRKSGRPRSAATQGAILSAALRLTAEAGYARLTVEGIATAAGVGKQTVYRWWPSKAAVVLEAFARDASAAVVVRRPTGDRRADLAAFLIQVHRRLSGAGGDVFRSLLAEALIDPAFAADLYRHYLTGRVDDLRTVLGDGDRHRLTLAVEMTYGAIWYRLVARQPLTTAVARRLADAAVDVLEG